ncbi:MAG TPA: hypothetical protein VJJ24_02700 [Candidatus Paceibacterota bacterium]
MFQRIAFCVVLMFHAGISFGQSWDLFGGQNLFGSWPADQTCGVVVDIATSGCDLFAALQGYPSTSANCSGVHHFDGSVWMGQIAGNGEMGSWGGAGDSRGCYCLASNTDTLFAGVGTGNAGGTASVWAFSFSASSWQEIFGNGIAGSWPAGSFGYVSTLAIDGSSLYVGVGDGLSSYGATVWAYDLSTGIGVQIGGDLLFGSWDSSGFGYTHVDALATGGGYLHASVSNGVRSSLFRRPLAGGNWEEIRGPWSVLATTAKSLAWHRGRLFAGLRSDGSEADLYHWDGLVWTRDCGDGLNGSWVTDSSDGLFALASVGNILYIGLGNSDMTVAKSEVWEWDGFECAQVGGRGLYGSWPSAAGIVGDIEAYGDVVVVGLGADPTLLGETWRFIPPEVMVPEVNGLRVERNSVDRSELVLTWTDVPSTRYDLLGGVIGELWQDHGFAGSNCELEGLTSPNCSIPLAGESKWFLVRARTSCPGAMVGTCGSSFYPPPGGGPDYRDFLDDPATDPCP